MASSTREKRFRIMQERHQGSAGQLYAMRKPTIAALPGPAAGAGLAIALACDLRIASASTFVRLGVEANRSLVGVFV